VAQPKSTFLSCDWFIFSGDGQLTDF